MSKEDVVMVVRSSVVVNEVVYEKGAWSPRNLVTVAQGLAPAPISDGLAIGWRWPGSSSFQSNVTVPLVPSPSPELPALVLVSLQTTWSECPRSPPCVLRFS
jgi:hypothetical protein